MDNPIEIRLKTCRSEIDRQLHEIGLPRAARNLYEPMRYALGAQGKRIRPFLTILVGEGFGIERARLMPAAVAIEILHTFSLVHDDIMDNDTHRRGQPTVHLKWDVNTALLSGDALLGLAFQTLMKTDTPVLQILGGGFSATMLEICEGQALDMAFESRGIVSETEYLEMVGKKTGALLGFACQAGMLFDNYDPEIAVQLLLFGKNLGEAFQIQDDLLEITSDIQSMGKSLGSDLAAEKKTYPLILALSDMTAAEQMNFVRFLKENHRDRERIVIEFRKHGALEDSKRKVSELLSMAMERLTVLPEKLQADLKNIVTLISNRKS